MKKLMVLIFLTMMSVSVYAVTAPSTVYVSADVDPLIIYIDGYATHSNIGSIDGMEFDVYTKTTREYCADSSWEHGQSAGVQPANPEKVGSTTYHFALPSGFYAFDKSTSEGRCYKTYYQDCGWLKLFGEVKLLARAYTISWVLIGGVFKAVYSYSSWVSSIVLEQGNHFDDCGTN